MEKNRKNRCRKSKIMAIEPSKKALSIKVTGNGLHKYWQWPTLASKIVATV
jgi:hypothetical protein